MIPDMEADAPDEEPEEETEIEAHPKKRGAEPLEPPSRFAHHRRSGSRTGGFPMA